MTRQLIFVNQNLKELTYLFLIMNGLLSTIKSFKSFFIHAPNSISIASSCKYLPPRSSLHDPRKKLMVVAIHKTTLKYLHSLSHFAPNVNYHISTWLHHFLERTPVWVALSVRLIMHAWISLCSWCCTLFSNGLCTWQSNRPPKSIQRRIFFFYILKWQLVPNPSLRKFWCFVFFRKLKDARKRVFETRCMFLIQHLTCFFF